jgi:hypothetical protein
VVAERGEEAAGRANEEKKEEQGQEKRGEELTAARRRLAAGRWWRCSPSPVAAAPALRVAGEAARGDAVRWRAARCGPEGGSTVRGIIKYLPPWLNRHDFVLK